MRQQGLHSVSMTQDAQQAAQVAALYTAIGRFAVAFEHVSSALYDAVLFMLSKEGLKNQQVANVILADMTAEPLRSLYAALIGEIRKPVGHEKAVISNILTRVQNLISKRNDVIHSTWHMDEISSTGELFTTATGHKSKKSNKGASVKFLEMKVQDFDALTAEASELSKLIGVMTGCHVFDMSINDNFSIGADKKVTTQVNFSNNF